MLRCLINASYSFLMFILFICKLFNEYVHIKNEREKHINIGMF